MTSQIRSKNFLLGDFCFDSGETVPDVRLAYETYGTLRGRGNNAILLLHALTGSHHAHGYNPDLPEATTFWQPENYAGWWEGMVGPDKPLDTNKYFIVCANYLGSCYGSTGPTSNAPDGSPWGSRFPMVTAADQARAQVQLMQALGIDRFTIVGPSVGGLVGLVLAGLYPDRIRSMILIGAGHKPLIEHQLSVFEQTLAIELDPRFRSGLYPLNDPPRDGVALARIICHKHFVNQRRLAQRAKKGGVQTGEGEFPKWYSLRTSMESYMLHQGTKFSLRFDANAYIRIVHMWADYDLPLLAKAKNQKEVFARYAKAKIPFLLFSINTDSCFAPRTVEALHNSLLRSGVSSDHVRIRSVKGHDSFLLEPELYERQIVEFLSRNSAMAQASQEKSTSCTQT